MLKISILAIWAFLLISPFNETKAQTKTSQSAPALINTCLITKDMKGLIKFYGNILQLPAKIADSTYAEFDTSVGVVAIFSYSAQQKYIPGSAEVASNRSAILEFRVQHVDKEYARLRPLVKVWVKPPTTQPWGTRSIYFRDPDGNLINFFEMLKRK